MDDDTIRQWACSQPGYESCITRKDSKTHYQSESKLLNPEKGAITLGIYNPSVLKDMDLQAKLVGVYDAWRRLETRVAIRKLLLQSLILSRLLALWHMCIRWIEWVLLMALRHYERIGANNGFTLTLVSRYDYTTFPSSSALGVGSCVGGIFITFVLTLCPQRGANLLIGSISTTRNQWSLDFLFDALLNAAGCSYLTFGYEPLTESGEIYGMPKWIQRLTRKTHKSVFQGLKVSGKKGYYDKWCPDEEQKTGLHLIFPAGTPGFKILLLWCISQILALGV